MTTLLKNGSTLQQGWTVLRDLTGAYTTDKPLLAAQLLGASGRGYVAEADRLERMLAQGPFQPGIDHAALVAKLKELLSYLDYAFTDPVVRERMRTGDDDDLLIPIFEDQFGFVSLFKSHIAELTLDNLPIPMEGPLYNSFRLMAEQFGVLIGVLFDLALYREQDLGDWMEPWANGVNNAMFITNWITSQEYLFPVWHRLSYIRERLVGRPGYLEYDQYAPNSFYHLQPRKNFSSYEAGDVYAQLQMLHGNLAKVELASGALPEGVALDPVTGNIFVEDLAEFKAGIFEGIAIGVHDTAGGYFYHIIEINIPWDVLPQYRIEPVMSISNYRAGDDLAYLDEVPGAKTKASRIIEGQLPQGVGFTSSLGLFHVEDPTVLKAGTYNFEVQVWTEEKADVVLPVSFQMDAALTPIEGPSYALRAPKPISSYVAGDIIAVPPASIGGWWCQTPGTSLSEGFEVNSKMEVVLADPSVLYEGEMQMTLTLNYNSGPPQMHLVDFIVYPDSAFDFTCADPKPISEFAAEDVIWEHPDYASSTVVATVISGPLPTGFEMDVAGKLIFDDAISALVAGTYFTVVNIVQSGVDMGNFVLVWTVLPDAGVTYTVNPAVVASALVLDDILAYPVVHYSTLYKIAVLSMPTAMPPGVSFATDAGNFYVSNPDAVVAGSWTLSVKSTLEDSTIEFHSVTINVL